MLRRTAFVAALAAAWLSVALPTAGALEASELEVVSVEGRTVTLLMTLDPTESIPTDASVTGTMELDGQVFPAETNLNVDDVRPRTGLLVLDASGSMAGGRLSAAQAAARQFLNDVPDDVRSGLVTFNDTVTVVQAPTNDTAAVVRAIDGVVADGDTTLYDAIAAGVGAVQGLDRPRLIVLSDGADTTSTASLASVRRLAQDNDVALDVVAIRPDANHQAVLRDLATSTGGRLFTAASSAEISRAFRAASGVFGAQVGLVGTIPESLDARSADLLATVSVGGRISEKSVQLPDTPTLASGVAPYTPATPAPASTERTVVQRLMPLLPAVIAALAVFAIVSIISSQRRRAHEAARLTQVLRYRSGAPGAAEPADSEPRPQLEWLERLLEDRAATRRMQIALQAGEIALTPATWVAIRLMIVLGLAAVSMILFGSLVIGVVLGALLGWVGTAMWLRSRARGRQKRFADELPDFLMLLASSLRAGLSFTHAMDAYVADSKGEVGRQMRRVLREVQVGAELDDALEICADRMDNEDLRWVVTALSIQREVGGSLSVILDAAAHTIKERSELQREVRTLSAEGRLSAYILIGLPVGVFLFLLLTRREYISALWTEPLGLVMLGALFVLLGVGVVWMRNVVRIKV